MYRQVGRALAVVATVGVVVSGCGAGPSQVGSAVIVGSTAVPLEQVQSRLDVALGKTDAVAQLASSGIGRAGHRARRRHPVPCCTTC